MELYFEVLSQLILEAHPNDMHTQRLVGLNYALDVPSFLDRTKYVNPDESLKPDGVKVATHVLTSALSANIHYAHMAGIKDSAQHLREIIADLERQFVLVTHFEPGKFNKS